MSLADGFTAHWKAGWDILGSWDEKVLDVPEDWKVVALATLGVPVEKPAARPKKPAGELFFMNAWGRRALD